MTVTNLRRARHALAGAALIAVGVAGAITAPAWEATTTHAGLTEQSAIASGLHQRLQRQFGADNGLYAQLTVPPADATALFAVLRDLNPTHGYVPDRRGRMFAIGWLVAGSVIADQPASHAADHFFDPITKRGLDEQTLRGMRAKLKNLLVPRLYREQVNETGVAAPDWVVDPNNPMNLDGFRDQYRKAVITRTPAERSRHLAGALLAAGAILHVLQDMGSPSHVRDDLAAHLVQIGNDVGDVGSRFERIAALAYGRLGVPAAGTVVHAADLRSFFTTDDGQGLADVTAAHWFSAFTLPRTAQLPRKLDPQILQRLLDRSLRRAAPRPTARIDLIDAARPEGAHLTDADGVCVARYRVSERRLRWSLPDDCALEQLAAILPTVGGYGAGLLDWLFRDAVDVSVVDNHLVATAKLPVGAGKVEFFWDDDRGIRASLAKTDVAATGAGATLGQAVIPPGEATRVTVLYVGVDAAGQPLVATSSAAYPLPVP